nr:PREDICTED: gem-associated protein 8-like [Bemisia tabaci]XP_018897542.1 PREDICTED: gem-associated protein 8-like [Bemisia tabaci]
MPRKNDSVTEQCPSQKNVTCSKKLSPIKPFSKVKTLKNVSMFRQKKKRRSKKKWNKRSSKNFSVPQKMGFPPVSCSIGSNSWFWSNYELAQRWQRAHMMSVEKANFAVSIFQQSLTQPFQQPFLKSNKHKKHTKHFSSQNTLDCGMDINFMSSLSSLVNNSDASMEDEIETCRTEDEYRFEFNVDENMRTFLEQSMRHKQEMQRLKDAELEESVDAEMFKAPKESAMEERKRTMSILYGDAAPKILSMEMALQMTFDRHFDQKQPAFWPNLPLLL